MRPKCSSRHDKLAADMAEELRPYNVACVSLWPRLTKTEDVLAQPDVYNDLTRAGSPRFTGQAVTALAADPDVMEKTGKILNVLDLAREYGFTSTAACRTGTTEAGSGPCSRHGCVPPPIGKPRRLLEA
jgi:hypothetical protein